MDVDADPGPEGDLDLDAGGEPDLESDAEPDSGRVDGTIGRAPAGGDDAPSAGPPPSTRWRVGRLADHRRDGRGGEPRRCRAGRRAGPVIDPTALTATSDLVLGLVVAVPVALVAGGEVLARRTRAGGSGGTPGTAPGDVAVAERPPPPPVAATAAGVAAAPEAAPAEAVPEPPPEPASYRGRLGKARGLLSGYVGAIRARGRIDAATWDDLEEAPSGPTWVWGPPTPSSTTFGPG